MIIDYLGGDHRRYVGEINPIGKQVAVIIEIRAWSIEQAIQWMKDNRYLE